MTAIQFASDCTVEIRRHMGSDDAIVEAMLVSTQGHDAIDTTAAKGRINFLMKNRHGTPFEHNAITMFVAAPIFVFREFHRHRIGFSYNEVSGRYKQLEPKFYIPPSERPLVQVGKPGEYKYVPGNADQYRMITRIMKDHADWTYRQYEYMLESGIAKEVARMILPVNIFTEMFVTCNTRSLMAFLGLRTDDERSAIRSTPMYEIDKMVARRMEYLLEDLFPLTYATFNANGRQAP